jgi:DNA-binding CsgD family transcriptional regulator
MMTRQESGTPRWESLSADLAGEDERDLVPARKLPDVTEARRLLKKLTPAEHEVFQLLSGGLMPDEIASVRSTTINTVRALVKTGKAKLGVRALYHAVAIVYIARDRAAAA